MHQNLPFEPKSRKISWGGDCFLSLDPVGRGHPLPTPYLPRRFRRLDPRDYGARLRRYKTEIAATQGFR